ncbi:unnamed protein product [Acanthoscelides obtectus]|uniref:Uncharacterized protein n=1 Tax=Acanthoscelides obtectus TaxID=200917 RepID=A0A9P0L6I5_ACAOB|nr:unnamed protein product [Acanthoscelides obtectus]CAK1633030.1 hypothetical protein AOBTE_LOCUS7886 [Acanthoscelides obtectus]
MSQPPLKCVIFEHFQEIVFFFELKKQNYLFLQFIKASQHATLRLPAYFCMEQKNICDQNRDPRKVK